MGVFYSVFLFVFQLGFFLPELWINLAKTVSGGLSVVVFIAYREAGQQLGLQEERWRRMEGLGQGMELDLSGHTGPRDEWPDCQNKPGCSVERAQPMQSVRFDPIYYFIVTGLEQDPAVFDSLSA